jgi:hypothetical protein
MRGRGERPPDTIAISIPLTMTRHVRAPYPEEGAHQHHAFEADVHDAAPLREHAPDGREDEWRGERQPERDQRRPGDDLFQVGRARLNGEFARGDRHQAACHGAPAHTPLAPGDRHPQRRDRAEDDRR